MKAIKDNAGREGSRTHRSPRLGSGTAIREAAAALFLERGYQGASLDDIAAAAKVSKQTIYTHFANKEELFADLVLGNAERVDEFATLMTTTVAGADGLEPALRALARIYITFLARPEVLRLRRLVIAEAGRFPELARTYYDRVPERVYQALAGILRQLADEGKLTLDDPLQAAHHFAWLVIGTPLDRGMFFEPEAVDASQLNRNADAAVRVFLAAYRS